MQTYLLSAVIACKLFKQWAGSFSSLKQGSVQLGPRLCLSWETPAKLYCPITLFPPAFSGDDEQDPHSSTQTGTGNLLKSPQTLSLHAARTLLQPMMTRRLIQKFISGHGERGEVALSSAHVAQAARHRSVLEPKSPANTPSSPADEARFMFLVMTALLNTGKPAATQRLQQHFALHHTKAWRVTWTLWNDCLLNKPSLHSSTGKGGWSLHFSSQPSVKTSSPLCSC